MHLLLVEDEPSLLHLLGQNLIRSGHTVESVSSAGAAKAMIASPFDAAIIDWTLPDGSGLEIGLALLERHLKIYVVFISGYPLGPGVVPASLSARVRILQKPFLPRALAEILKAL